MTNLSRGQIVAIVVFFILGATAFTMWPASVQAPLERKPSVTAESPLRASYDLDNGQFKLSGERTAMLTSDDGKATMRVTVFGEPTYGDLDGDGDADAVTILTAEPGGSGTFYYAALSVLGDDGKFTGSKAVFLGDRIAPQTVEISDGIAVVNYAVRAEGEDFSVAPSFGKSAYLAIEPGTTTTVLRPPADAALEMLRSKAWIWVETGMNDGSVTKPKNPEVFTLQFGADGRVAIATDCNSGSGSYEAGDAGLVFGPIATTRMYCEGSQEQEFLKKLAEVQSFLFHEGRLVLEIKYDSGTMTFR